MLINYLTTHKKVSASNDSISFPGFIKQLKIFPRAIYSRPSQKSYSNLRTTLPKLERPVKKSDQSSEIFQKISASSWIVFNKESQSVLLGSKQYVKREIASISKIMTCVICIEELIFYNKSFEELVEISFAAGSVQGTSAGLAYKDRVRVIDLIFALMLPSGNDAAVALSEFFGGLMPGSGTEKSRFITKMNEKAKSLGMKDTNFTNPHGMSTSLNVSTAYDIAILCEYALKVPIFTKIVSCPKYSCEIVVGKGVKKVVWKNTNKLLKKGFYGIKTGFTPAAGPCLSCAIGNLIIVLLGCNSRHDRWTDSLQLLEFIKKQVSENMNT